MLPAAMDERFAIVKAEGDDLEAGGGHNLSTPLSFPVCNCFSGGTSGLACSPRLGERDCSAEGGRTIFPEGRFSKILPDLEEFTV